MVVHALILARVRSRQTDLYEFEPILAHIVRSKTAKAAYWDLTSKKQIRNIIEAILLIHCCTHLYYIIVRYYSCIAAPTLQDHS